METTLVRGNFQTVFTLKACSKTYMRRKENMILKYIFTKEKLCRLLYKCPQETRRKGETI
jgi:hypothetical protein